MGVACTTCCAQYVQTWVSECMYMACTVCTGLNKWAHARSVPCIVCADLGEWVHGHNEYSIHGLGRVALVRVVQCAWAWVSEWNHVTFIVCVGYDEWVHARGIHSIRGLG